VKSCGLLASERRRALREWGNLGALAQAEDGKSDAEKCEGGGFGTAMRGSRKPPPRALANSSKCNELAR
jgi:hypothetical protein